MRRGKYLIMNLLSRFSRCVELMPKSARSPRPTRALKKTRARFTAVGMTRSLETRKITSLVLAAALTFPCAPAQQPQGEKEKQGLYRLRVETELVLVNVVVHDKQGQLVRDLKRDDFTVLEDG